MIIRQNAYKIISLNADKYITGLLLARKGGENMLIAELYKQSDNSMRTGFKHTDGRHEGLALAAEIIKKHKAGLTSVQIAMDCSCSLDDVGTIVRNI